MPPPELLLELLPPELLPLEPLLPPELLPLLEPPASPGGGGGGPLHGPQMPVALPGAETHEVPGQQSALFVQPPHACTQLVVEQMKRGVPPSTGFGTHGR